jgi:hypothetical protein
MSASDTPEFKPEFQITFRTQLLTCGPQVELVYSAPSDTTKITLEWGRCYTSQQLRMLADYLKQTADYIDELPDQTGRIGS